MISRSTWTSPTPTEAPKVGDFDHAGDVATFAALSTAAQQITIDIADDNLVEAVESFTAALGTSTVLGDRSIDTADGASVDITDNDTAVFTVEDVTVNEGDAAATLTISVSNPIDVPIDIDVAILTVQRTLVTLTMPQMWPALPANSTTAQQVTIAITDDNIVEAV